MKVQTYVAILCVCVLGIVVAFKLNADPAPSIGQPGNETSKSDGSNPQHGDARPSPGSNKQTNDSNRVPVHVPEPVPDGHLRASDLVGEARQALAKLNKTLKKAGVDLVPGSAVIDKDDLPVFTTMIKNDHMVVKEAEEGVREIQRQYCAEMVKDIRETVEAGGQPKYANISGTQMPRNRHPYDLFITASHHGQVYLMTLPHTKQVMDSVDRLRANKSFRLANAKNVLKPLFKESKR